MREKPLLQRGSDGEVFAEHLTKHLTKHLTTGESLTASPKGRGLSGKYRDALRPQQLIRPQKKWGFKIPASQQPNINSAERKEGEKVTQKSQKPREDKRYRRQVSRWEA
jgi:hypothetical protein